MAKAIKAVINPELIGWARESAGYDVESAARALDVKTTLLKAWEERRGSLSLSQLREVARVFKRPLAVFFLPEPPRDFTALRDFRRPFGLVPQPHSFELLLEIRRAESRRETALELAEEMGLEIPEFTLSATREDDPEDVAKKARTALNVSVDDQTGWQSDTRALETWRHRLEALGILVFQASDLKRDEARGFSISEKPFPVVVLAGGETNRPRIFTAMHELTHLILRTGGICDLEDDEDTESFCNRVAGAILVPRDALLAQPAVASADRNTQWSDDELKRYADLFMVSQETLLRRLLILKKTSTDFYKRKRSEFLVRYSKLGKSFGTVPYHTKIIRRNGYFYVGLVLDAYRTEAITSSDVSDYLGGMNLKHLPEIERVLSGER